MTACSGSCCLRARGWTSGRHFSLGRSHGVFKHSKISLLQYGLYTYGLVCGAGGAAGARRDGPAANFVGCTGTQSRFAYPSIRSIQEQRGRAGGKEERTRVVRHQRASEASGQREHPLLWARKRSAHHAARASVGRCRRAEGRRRPPRRYGAYTHCATLAQAPAGRGKSSWPTHRRSRDSVGLVSVSR